MKKAFTLFELILVVLILGIFINLGLANLKEDKIYQGTKQIVTHLKYLRSLALTQSVQRPANWAHYKAATPTTSYPYDWFNGRWMMYFISNQYTQNELTYSLFLDFNGDGNVNENEMALDILNPHKFMSHGQSGILNTQNEQHRRKMTKRLNIEREFGIVDAKLFGACGANKSTKIVFDEFGRVFNSITRKKIDLNKEYDKIGILNKNDCIIKLSSKYKNHLCIIIDKLSGMPYIPPFESFNSQNIKFNNKIIKCKDL